MKTCAHKADAANRQRMGAFLQRLKQIKQPFIDLRNAIEVKYEALGFACASNRSPANRPRFRSFRISAGPLARSLYATT
jgi:hypothetical protein